MTETNKATVDRIVAQLKMKMLYRGDVISQAINLIERLNEQLIEAENALDEVFCGDRE